MPPSIISIQSPVFAHVFLPLESPARLPLALPRLGREGSWATKAPELFPSPISGQMVAGDTGAKDFFSPTEGVS